MDTNEHRIKKQTYKTLLNLIEKLRIKNGKEFVRGMETNEKSWQAKIEAKIKELENRAKEYGYYKTEIEYARNTLQEIIGE